MAERVRPTRSPVMVTLLWGTMVKRISFMKPKTLRLDFGFRGVRSD